jgi:hypothetical protein
LRQILPCTPVGGVRDVSEEMSVTELDSDSTGTAEAREDERTPCTRDPVVRFLVRPSFRSHWAIIRDISRRGIGLLVGCPLEENSVLAIQLTNKLTNLSCILTARVRHVTQLSESCWLLGCSLSRGLSAYERAALENS